MNRELAKKILEQTRASYDAAAVKFAHSRWRAWPIMQATIDKYVQPGQRVLDVGCGNGRLWESLKPKGVSYLGVDSSQELINLAPQDGARFQVKDILDLDFKQEFDAVFTFAVIGHLPSPELRLKALKNIFAALKPGGYFICTNWNFWRLSRREKTIWRYKIFERVKGERGLPACAGRGFRDIMTYFQDEKGAHPLYYYAFTLGELRRLMSRAGFLIKESYYEANNQPISWARGNNLVLVGQRPPEVV